MERLSEGPVIGDGGFVFQLEKRGYVKVSIYSEFVNEYYVKNIKLILK